MLHAISFAEWGTPYLWIFNRIKVSLRLPSTQCFQNLWRDVKNLILMRLITRCRYYSKDLLLIMAFCNCLCFTEVKNRHTSGPLEKREKHLGDLRHMVADGNPKPDKKYLFEKLQQSQTQLQAEMQANSTNADHRRSSDVLSSSHGSTDCASSRRQRRDSDGPNGSRTLNRLGTRHGEFCVCFWDRVKSVVVIGLKFKT